MPITLSPQVQKLIKARLKSGRYSTANDVVLAGLGSLSADEKFGDFATGELDELLSQGERSIKNKGILSAEQVANEMKRQSQALRRPSR